MARPNTELRELVRRYQNKIGPETGEESAEFLLRARAAEAVPVVVKAFDALCWGTGIPQMQVDFQAMVRLAGLLAELGDPRATPALIYLAQFGDEFIFENPLRRLIVKLAPRADREAIAALLEILTALRHARPSLALLVAEQLVTLAEQNPVQELAAALPLLRCGLLDPAAPLEFAPLRKRLKAALNLTHLPLAASAPLTTESLPVPSEARDSDD